MNKDGYYLITETAGNIGSQSLPRHFRSIEDAGEWIEKNYPGKHEWKQYNSTPGHIAAYLDTVTMGVLRPIVFE